MAVGISSHGRLYRRRGDCCGWVSDTKWEPFFETGGMISSVRSCVLYRSVLCVLWPNCAQSCSFSCRRLLLLLMMMPASGPCVAASTCCLPLPSSFSNPESTFKGSKRAGADGNTLVATTENDDVTQGAHQRRATPYAIRQTVRTQGTDRQRNQVSENGTYVAMA